MSKRLELFLGLSVELTAFTRFDLLGTGQAESYLTTVDSIVGDGVTDALLAAFQVLPSESERRQQAIRQSILGDEKLGPIARSVIKLWYSGTWYELPSDWTERFGPCANDITFVVSAASYVEGLLWKAIGAHPAGAKAPGYGSWAAPPTIPAFDGDPASS